MLSVGVRLGDRRTPKRFFRVHRLLSRSRRVSFVEPKQEPPHSVNMVRTRRQHSLAHSVTAALLLASGSVSASSLADFESPRGSFLQDVLESKAAGQKYCKVRQSLQVYHVQRPAPSTEPVRRCCVDGS